MRTIPNTDDPVEWLAPPDQVRLYHVANISTKATQTLIPHNSSKFLPPPIGVLGVRIEI
jgi:hypothetical protein